MLSINREKTQRINSLDDLECLLSGDAIEIHYEMKGFPGRKSAEVGFYHHKDSSNNQMVFLIPRMGIVTHLLKYSADPNNILFEDGSILLKEEKSHSKTIGSCDKHYKQYMESVKFSKL